MKSLIKLYYSIMRSLLLHVLSPDLSSGKKIDFIVIGAQKSGTTALDFYLRFHPEIGLPIRKELHFFNNNHLFQLPARLREIHYHQFFCDFAQPDKLLGEATPNYMVETLFMDRIHAYNSALKLIVILRDPVSRAYSHWNMQRDRDIEHRTFEQAIRENIIEIKNKLLTDERFNYLQWGEYARQLKYVSTLFPREQVLIVFQGDLRTSPLKTMNQITQFLDVSPFKHVSAMDMHRRAYTESMSDSLKNEIKAYYLPHIEELEQFLNTNLSHWK
jgi:hypothetical protein